MVSQGVMFVGKMVVFAAIVSLFYLIGKLGFIRIFSKACQNDRCGSKRISMLSRMPRQTAIKMLLVMFVAYLVLEFLYLSSKGGFGTGNTLDGSAFLYFLTIGLGIYFSADIWMNCWLWQGSVPKLEDNVFLLCFEAFVEVGSLIVLTIAFDRALSGDILALFSNALVLGMFLWGMSLAVSLGVMIVQTTAHKVTVGA